MPWMKSLTCPYISSVGIMCTHLYMHDVYTADMIYTGTGSPVYDEFLTESNEHTQQGGGYDEDGFRWTNIICVENN